MGHKMSLFLVTKSNVKTMKKVCLIIVSLILTLSVFSQDYFPFPTDTAKWNCLDWWQWSPEDIILTNYQYIMNGDTVISGKNYNKIYHQNIDINSETILLGGLREDSLKNVYFYPINTDVIPPTGGLSFPNDSSENLLYTFNNLSIGMILPINSELTEIKVIGIDSVLIGDKFRKRYQIENNRIGSLEYWIEGIGSTYELFSPFTWQFEWENFTLCFTDSITYYINSPNGEDSCHYALPTGIKEDVISEISLFPNPVEANIKFNNTPISDYKKIEIFDTQSRLVFSRKISTGELTIDVSELNSGLYFIIFSGDNRKATAKFIKK
jgi:hypothetical protein